MLADDGTASSAVASADVALPACRSMQFDGSNDYLVTSDSFSLGSSYTVEAWLYWQGATPQQWQSVLNHGGGPTDERLFVRSTTGAISHEDGLHLGGTGTVVSGSWTHLAATYDRSASRSEVWVDGVRASSVSASFVAAMTDVLSMGGYASSPTAYPFYGKIHSVRATSGVRYTSTFSPAAFVSDASTVGMWNMSDATTTSVPDASGHGHDATISGAVPVVACPF